MLHESIKNKTTMLPRNSSESGISLISSSQPENRSNPIQRRFFQRWASYVFSNAGKGLSLKQYYLRPCFEPYFTKKNENVEPEDVELIPLTQKGKRRDLRKQRDLNKRKNVFFIEKESRHNLQYWFDLGLVWTITLVLIFVRGGKGADSIFGVPFCGFAYWCVSLVAIVVLSAVSTTMLLRLVHESLEKHLCGYQFAEGDVI